MTSITTFAYGLTVRATDLIAAASAWPQLEPVFRFFDLVYLRRRRGSLAGSETVGRVPVEVWENVKQYLVVGEKEVVEDKIVRSVWKRGKCEEPDCRLADESRYTWDDYADVAPGCNTCQPLRFEYLASLVDGFDEFDEFKGLIQDLVATFGLAHPLDRLIGIDREYSADDQALAVISIPKQFRDLLHWQRSTISSSCPVGHQPDQYTIVNVDFSLPPNPNARFVRFVRTFNLEVVDVLQVAQGPIGPRAVAAVGKGLPRELMARVLRAEQSEIHNRVSGKIRPQWRLYTVVLDRVE